MLSSRRIEEIHQELNRIEKSQKSKQSRNRRQHLNKKLDEHYYATNHEPFIPLPHQLRFVNHTTSSRALQQLIEMAEACSEILIDTESINVPHQRNEPALIQVQLVLTDQPSMIILSELFHLPPQDHLHFQMIKRLFGIIFNPMKHIYLWGESTELHPFIKSKLFNRIQINEMKYCNVQRNYKRYRIEHYPHRRNASKQEPCQCERCLGHQPNHLWGLQEAMAIELDRYLSKEYTIGNFHIGLDERLNTHMNHRDEDRTQLITYAAYDVLSMQQIKDKMSTKNFQFDFRSTTTELEFMFDSSSDTDDDALIISRSNMFKPEPPPKATSDQIELEITAPDMDEEEPVTPHQPNDNLRTTANSTEQEIIEPKPMNPLSKEERAKIHNRSRSLHQRIQAYKEEIIIHNIDHRFPIGLMKKILKRHGVPITRIHPTKSKYSSEYFLYVGLRERMPTEKYNEVKNLFNHKHYHEIFANKSSRSNRQRPKIQSTTSRHRHGQHHHRE